MAFNQRDFRKDKAKAVKLRTPLEDIARNNSVQPVGRPGVSRSNADYLISNRGENINSSLLVQGQALKRK